jgi:hypothetical protein
MLPNGTRFSSIARRHAPARRSGAPGRERTLCRMIAKLRVPTYLQGLDRRSRHGAPCVGELLRQLQHERSPI